MPFLLLVCGLLGGALVSALVISTTLDAGSFKITQLQQQDIPNYWKYAHQFPHFIDNVPTPKEGQITAPELPGCACRYWK